jgi:hypothetical protein
LENEGGVHLVAVLNMFDNELVVSFENKIFTAFLPPKASLLPLPAKYPAVPTLALDRKSVV